MNTIKYEDFNPKLGTLIKLDDEEIKLGRILDNPKKYLDKDKTYYFLCKNGIQSKRAVQILSVYGYKVYRVVK